MFLSGLRTKAAGYRRWLSHEHYMWSCRRESQRNTHRYERWLQQLQANPPDVFVGADFPNGGVREHVRAIQRYSSLRVQLVPDEAALGSHRAFTEELRCRFLDYEPLGRPVVHSHVMPWMIRWCRRQQERGLKWVHTYHLNYFPDHGRKAIEPWQQEINDALINEARHADIRLSVSKWQQTYLLENFGIKTDYLPNGVDVELCDRADAPRFRRRSGVRGPFVLYVGRNDPVKNPADFVRLAQRLPAHQFVMIGHGFDCDTLQAQVSCPLPKNLQIVAGLPHQEVLGAIAACSALVVTSRREGLPTLVLEALALNRPVVVPNDPGCMEAVGNGKLGAIYEQGDLDQLERAALQCFESPTAKNSRDWVLANFDWRKVIKELDAIYRGGF